MDYMTRGERNLRDALEQALKKQKQTIILLHCFVIRRWYDLLDDPANVKDVQDKMMKFMKQADSLFDTQEELDQAMELISKHSK